MLHSRRPTTNAARIRDGSGRRSDTSEGDDMSVESSAPPRNAIPPDERILVGEDDAARLLSMSKPTLRKYVRDGLIARVESPLQTRRNWYRVEDLRAFAGRLNPAVCARRGGTVAGQTGARKPVAPAPRSQSIEED